MRSHHADADDADRGELRLRARRRALPRPPHSRTDAQGQARRRRDQAAPDGRALPHRAQDGKEVEQPIESGWSKVTDEVVELLGFESRQFRQVIMLPQGKFFEFLKSSSQEREKILQTLFGTELYKRIEER